MTDLEAGEVVAVREDSKVLHRRGQVGLLAEIERGWYWVAFDHERWNVAFRASEIQAVS